MTDPEPSPPAELAAELAPCFLPPLLGRMEEARGRLDALVLRLAGDPADWCGDEELLAEAEALRGREAEIGWCLGILAAATGAGLLGTRRERDGLALAARVVGEGLAVRLDPSPGCLPPVGTGVGEGWELPLAVACFFREAGRKTPDAVLRWRLEHAAGCRVLSCPDVPRCAPRGAAWAPLLARMPGIVLGEGAHPTLTIPEPWFGTRERRAKNEA